MNEICGDNRFEIIAKAKAHLLDATNIDTSEDEMKVLDSFLFRCWQMGWLDRYAEQTEPQTERIKTLDYCDICNHKGCDNCIANNLDDYCVPSGYEPTTQTETKNSNLPFEKCEYCEYRYARYVGVCDMCELIGDEPNCSEKPNNCEPQKIGYCNECKWFRDKQVCGRCRSKNLYAPKDEPQTDCPYREYPCDVCDMKTDCSWK